MPRKKTNSSKMMSRSDLKKKSSWGGYVSCNLSVEEVKAFEAYVEKEGDDLVGLVETVLKAGYDLSIILDDANAAYVARLYWIDSMSYKAYMLTAFAPDWLTAVKLVLFKHFIVLDSDWSSGLQGDVNRPLFG